MKHKLPDNYYAQLAWVIARKIIISDVMLIVYSVMLIVALTYLFGWLIYYADPTIGAFLGSPKASETANRFMAGVTVVVILCMIIALAAFLIDVCRKSRDEVLEKMDRKEKARRQG